METRANYVLVGAFVLVLLAGLLVAGLWFARVQFNQQSTFYDIYFNGSVTGLTDGSAVRYNGIPVGRVTSIQLDPENPQRVRVTVQLSASTVVRSDAVASLEVQGITGGAFIEIAGGGNEAPPLERHEGQRYPVIVSTQSGLQRVVAGAPELLSRVIELSDRLALLLDDHNRAALAETLDNVRRLTAVAAGHAGDIDSALGDGAAAIRDLRVTLATANQALAELKQLLGPDGQMRTTVKSVDEGARKLAELTRHLDTIVQENRAPLRDFTQRGLSEVQQLLADARVLVNQLTRIADTVERDPARFLYGDRREGYQPR
jgi:phospholipid/cholesterol/gamma-HCH transport system substrate-binding protein